MLTILLVAASLFSRSRAGITLTVMAMVIAFIVFIRQVGGWKHAGMLLILFVSAFGVAMGVGIISTLNRFLALDPFEDGRWKMFETSIVGIKIFFPVGSGPGTFQEIYSTLQSPDQLRFINHAHNDYLELLFEMGAIGLVFISIFLVVFIKGWLDLRNYAGQK